jgi:hypothetical protein
LEAKFDVRSPFDIQRTTVTHAGQRSQVIQEVMLSNPSAHRHLQAPGSSDEVKHFVLGEGEFFSERMQRAAARKSRSIRRVSAGTCLRTPRSLRDKLPVSLILANDIPFKADIT